MAKRLRSRSQNVFRERWSARRWASQACPASGSSLGGKALVEVREEDCRIFKGEVGGANRIRTDDLLRAREALSQLSYRPITRSVPARPVYLRP
jgi:hypothetical protein